MPKLKEAAVAVTGAVIDIEQLIDFKTKKLDGAVKVVLATGDGFAAVKITAEDVPGTMAAVDFAHFGDSVAWMVRFGAYQMGEQDAQASCRFLREVGENDLDRLVSSSHSTPASGK
jgi:hypothetical protein